MAKPTNRFYVGGPTLDPPEDWVMINCPNCHKSAYSAEWRKNRGYCPQCQAPYKSNGSEED